jgi:UDP:flavonoid glycosyltransferase YjiC (YdhE family)
MHAVLVSVGTDGDIFPYVGLGAALQAHGRSVTLVVSEDYEPLARRHGLAFQALVSAEENQELFGHPDFWNPLKTAPLAARWGLRFVRRQYDLLSKLVTPEMVLVASPAVFAASLIHEKLGVRWTNLIFQPWMIPSCIAPPIIPNFTFLSRAPRLIWKVFWRGLDAVGDILVGRELNRLRAALGLNPMRRIFRNWLAKELVIGMFPDWYGQPQADWPPQMRLTGFPLFDGGQNEMPPGVLEFCRAGSPPLAFTFGTGMAHSSGLFRAALEACEILHARGIFLTRYRDQLPDSLPASVMHCAFAPFQKLFPHCAAVVHHGGIGTVAKAMAAGIPQLIHPICFDQIDNGMRVKRLGVGDCLRAKRANGKQIAAALPALLTDECRTSCCKLMTRFEKTDAFGTAAELIEKLAMDRATTSTGVG